MQLTINNDFSKLAKDLGEFKKQIPFALASALTKTAQASQRGVIKQAEKDIDRPTPFTLKGFVVSRATKRRLKATLSIKPVQADYLKYQIDGGTRRKKKGKPVLIPGKNLRLNKYGNITKNRLRGKTSKNMFTKDGIIYQRLKKRVKALAFFKDKADYSKRFRYYERAIGEAKANFGKEFDKSLANAIRTAR